MGLFINLIIHYSLFFWLIVTIHYNKKGHYSLIIIPHPDPLVFHQNLPNVAEA